MIRDKKAFTLIELIVTISVLGVLVLLASPRLFGHVQNAELTKGFANAKSIEKASEIYYMDHKDWPRLTDEPYTSEEIKSYSERIFDRTGKEVILDPEGNYYDIDYDKLSDYIQVPDDKKNYILQNPVGKVFYMENLNETGVARVNYSREKDDNPIPVNEPINFAYTGQPQEIELGKGTYKLEVWGAQGGGHSSTYGPGKGGYAKGEINLHQGNKLLVYVGGQGVSSEVRNASAYVGSGGFNGGGDLYHGSGVGGPIGAGGGGSDIRINSHSLYSRVIVAGGGGGAHNDYSPRRGGYGGGLVGGWGGANEGDYSNEGGNQSGPGTKHAYDPNYAPRERASFGQGAHAGAAYGAGGGGGWYGGNASGHSGAGGGSGYVLTASSHKPSGYLLTSYHWMVNTQLVAGNQSMPNPSGGTMVGNSGHGFARITRVD